MSYEVKTEKPVYYSIRFGIPRWAQGKMKIIMNGEEIQYEEKQGFAVVNRIWNCDKMIVEIPKGITCWPLADEETTVAFLDGSVLLAGLVGEERIYTVYFPVKKV